MPFCRILIVAERPMPKNDTIHGFSRSASGHTVIKAA